MDLHIVFLFKGDSQQSIGLKSIDQKTSTPKSAPSPAEIC